MKLRNLIASVFAAVIAVCTATPAAATTNCTSTVANIYTGDGGAIYVALLSGVTFYLAATDANMKNVLASATLAMKTSGSVQVLFTANGASCSSGNRTDFVGLYTFP